MTKLDLALIDKRFTDTLRCVMQNHLSHKNFMQLQKTLATIVYPYAKAFVFGVMLNAALPRIIGGTRRNMGGSGNRGRTMRNIMRRNRYQSM